MRTSGRPIVRGELVVGISGIASDITEQKRAEKSLRESEQRFRALFENSPISLWEEDFSAVRQYIERLRAKGESDFRKYFKARPDEVRICAEMIKTVHVNRTTCELFGATDKHELLKELGAESRYGSHESIVEQLVAIAGGIQEFQVESKSRTLGGGELDIILKWAVMPGSELTYSNVLVSLTDITDVKRAEQELDIERGILRDILEDTLAGYWDWNIPNNTEYLSPTFKKMFGYEDHELPNMPETWLRLIFEEDRSRVMQNFDEHVKSQGKIPYYNEVRYRHKNGSPVWVISRVTSLSGTIRVIP